MLLMSIMIKQHKFHTSPSTSLESNDSTLFNQILFASCY